MNLLVLLAQTTTPATSQPAPPLFVFLQSYGPLVLLLVVFFFLMSGSKRKQEKQRQQMLKELQRGVRIQTIGGIIGTVVEARDNEVVVKVDESNNTKVKFARSAIHKVLMDEEKTETK